LPVPFGTDIIKMYFILPPPSFFAMSYALTSARYYRCHFGVFIFAPVAALS
jgi:hypothetical protein